MRTRPWSCPRWSPTWPRACNQARRKRSTVGYSGLPYAVVTSNILLTGGRLLSVPCNPDGKRLKPETPLTQRWVDSFAMALLRGSVRRVTHDRIHRLLHAHLRLMSVGDPDSGRYGFEPPPPAGSAVPLRVLRTAYRGGAPPAGAAGMLPVLPLARRNRLIPSRDGPAVLDACRGYSSPLSQQGKTGFQHGPYTSIPQDCSFAVRYERV